MKTIDIGDLKAILREKSFKFEGKGIEELLPDEKVVQDKNWKARIYVDIDYIFMIDFFLTAIKPYQNLPLLGCVSSRWSSSEKLDIISIEATHTGIYDFIFNTDLNCTPQFSPAIITNSNIDFLLVKDAENEMVCMFGDEEFIKKVMPISDETYEIYYNEYKYGFTDNPEYDSKFIQWFWNTYPKK